MCGKSGVKEYWLIDLKEEFIYTYSYRNGFDYRRYSFEQNIRSRCYPGFECCISDILWEDGGSLRELALFYRFKKEVYPESAVQLVAEQSSTYGNQSSAEQQYSADAFYEWLSTRKNVQQYTSMVELLMGNIRETVMPAYRYQNIRGNIYFTVKTYLKMKGLPYQMCFAPIAVELKKLDMLDSVVSPDLFLIGSEEMIYDHIYRGVPEWIIEIVTPATASQDYIDKAQLYQYHGVREYWIVNDWKRQVMVVGYLDESITSAPSFGRTRAVPTGAARTPSRIAPRHGAAVCRRNAVPDRTRTRTVRTDLPFGGGTRPFSRDRSRPAPPLLQKRPRSTSGRKR